MLKSLHPCTEGHCDIRREYLALFQPRERKNLRRLTMRTHDPGQTAQRTHMKTTETIDGDSGSVGAAEKTGL